MFTFVGLHCKPRWEKFVCVKKEWVHILTAGLIQRFGCLTVDPSRTSGVKEDEHLLMGQPVHLLMTRQAS